MVIAGVVLALGVVMMLVERLRVEPGPRCAAGGGARSRSTRAGRRGLARRRRPGTAGFERHGPGRRTGSATIGGAIVGYLAITFVYYWWHRWRHESPFLWRWFHQVHHSPQRIEIITSFYKHPLEIVAEQRAVERDPVPACVGVGAGGRGAAPCC